MMVWVFLNVWFIKIISIDLKLDGNEVVIDIIEIVYEILMIKNENNV